MKEFILDARDYDKKLVTSALESWVDYIIVKDENLDEVKKLWKVKLIVDKDWKLSDNFVEIVIKNKQDEEKAAQLAKSGKKVIVIEDAPTVTHGGLPYGAGYIAAIKYGAEVIDPRPYAVGVIKKIYEEYVIGPVLPSLGYTQEQKKDLEETIRRVDADFVLIASPARLEKIINIDKPVVRVWWELKILEGPTIRELVDVFLERIK